MIITIKGADFSSANIGTLNTFVVSKIIGSGSTYSIPNYVDKNSSVEWTITLEEGYTFGTYSIIMGGTTVTPTINDNVMTISIPNIIGNIIINVTTVNESIGGDEEEDGEIEYVLDFDFVGHTLMYYKNMGLFTIPESVDIETLSYDNQKGLNNNGIITLGLPLTNPIDATRPWTFEMDMTIGTPSSEIAGNRKAFLTSSEPTGSSFAPFIVINSNTVETLGFQVSNGNHLYMGGSKLVYDAEANYKIVYDGTNVKLFINGTSVYESPEYSFTGNFTHLFGTAPGKSVAYNWADTTESKSYLKHLKFYYNK